MAILKCLLCGEEINTEEAKTIDWLYGCELCSGQSLCKVIDLQKDEISQMLDLVENNFVEPKFAKDAVLYSLKDPGVKKIKYEKIAKILVLLCIIFERIIIDSPINLIGCKKEVLDTVNELMNEKIIFLSEMQPSFISPITKGPPIEFLEKTPWAKKKNILYHPFAKPTKKAVEVYFSLMNLALALTSSEIDRIYLWGLSQPHGTIGRKLLEFGYSHPWPEVLWLNLHSINYYLYLSSLLKTQLIFPESRASIFNLKYGEFLPQQKKIGSVMHLVKKRKLSVPNFNADNILKLRSSDEVRELKIILDKLINKRENENYLVEKYDEVVNSFNSEVGKYETIGSASLSGILATVGGLTGGLAGAVIGGIGGTIASCGLRYLIRQHYVSKKRPWPFIFIG